MVGQSGMTMKRFHAAWHAAHHSSCPSSNALVRHRTSHDACESRGCEQSSEVHSHMGVQLKVSRLHTSVIDGTAVGYDHGALPRRVACSTSAVLAIRHRATAHHPTSHDACSHDAWSERQSAACQGMHVRGRLMPSGLHP